jgi:hypothetical protein
MVALHSQKYFEAHLLQNEYEICLGGCHCLSLVYERRQKSRVAASHHPKKMSCGGTALQLSNNKVCSVLVTALDISIASALAAWSTLYCTPVLIKSDVCEITMIRPPHRAYGNNSIRCQRKRERTLVVIGSATRLFPRAIYHSGPTHIFAELLMECFSYAVNPAGAGYAILKRHYALRAITDVLFKLERVHTNTYSESTVPL